MSCIAYSQQFDSVFFDELSRSNLKNALVRLNSFLKIPNASRDLINIQKNVNWCQNEFEDLDFRVKRFNINGTPFLLASKTIDDRLPSLLVYLQIDGVSVDISKWAQKNPYVPVVKNNKGEIIDWDTFIKDPELNSKIYARSSSDSKGPAVAFISALEIMKKEELSLPYNVKVIMDFEEEISSPNLPILVKREIDAFKAKYLLIMDGSRFVENKPTLTFGARGIAKVDMTLFGPNVPVHSGQYGNFIPNPIYEASRLISSLKDSDGKVLIPNWYKDVQIDENELALINKDMQPSLSIAHDFGVSSYEKVGQSYQESLQYPSLNIRGIASGFVGKKARTIIPDKVEISIDIRLVPELGGEEAIRLLRQHLRTIGYRLLQNDPDAKTRKKYSKLVKFQSSIGYPAFQTPLSSNIGIWLKKAHMNALGFEPISIRRTGGSQPMAPFVNVLNLPAVAVRIPNPDNQIHAPNENIRVGNFLEGIRINLGILTTPFE